MLQTLRLQINGKDLKRIQSLESNGHVGSLPADSEQFMMIEDLYKTVGQVK